MSHFSPARSSSPWQAGVVSKLLLLLVLLSLIITSQDFRWLLAVCLIFLLVACIARMPLGHIASLLFLPIITAAWLGVANLGGGLPWFVLALRAAAAGLVVITIASTSPLEEWFAILRYLLPSLLLDALYLSLKGVEEAIRRFQERWLALRLRGLEPGRMNKQGIILLTACFGGVVLESWDKAEETANMLMLRGYKPGLLARGSPWRWNWQDSVSLLASVAIAWWGWVLRTQL